MQIYREIYGYLKKLSNFPIKEDANESFVQEVHREFSSQYPEKAVILIKNSLGLADNKKVKVNFFNDHAYFRHNNFGRNEMRDWAFRMAIGNLFETPLLLSGKKAVAYIKIFPRMPLYGTREFAMVPIELSIAKSILCRPTEIFIQVISHELSHFILHGLKHALRESEKATDLLSMMLGFRSIICKNKNQIGYLSEAETEAASNMIRAGRIIKKIKVFSQ
jgi:hypothetical protein